MSLLERCPHFRGCYLQASMELGLEDMSLLERCPHFRGCYVQASMELGPEDVPSTVYMSFKQHSHYTCTYVSGCRSSVCIPHSSLQVHQLHTVLVKKRDPHTQVPFLDTIEGVCQLHSPVQHAYYSVFVWLRHFHLPCVVDLRTAS